MQTQNAIIRVAGEDDFDVLLRLATVMGNGKGREYFELAMEYQALGSRVVFIITQDGEDAGYCMLAWEPKYAFYRKLGVPEIQDLNVLPAFRRRGLGRHMIEHCEDLVRQKGLEMIGIGVGMDPSYGAAQRLYVRLGYVPDGNGLTYDRKIIAKGSFLPVDDEMSLMFIKDLQN